MIEKPLVGVTGNWRCLSRLGRYQNMKKRWMT